jgi:Arc/MetJ-type ribon-helix-helix transcriptional regulator
MVRTQIQLPKEQVAMLKRMAASQQVSMAEVIRQAVALLAQARGEAQRRERALRVAGRFHSGLGNLAAEHDAHLAEAFGE